MKKRYITPTTITVKIETSSTIMALSSTSDKASNIYGMEARSYIDNPEEDDFVSSQNVWDNAW